MFAVDLQDEYGVSAGTRRCHGDHDLRAVWGAASRLILRSPISRASMGHPDMMHRHRRYHEPSCQVSTRAIPCIPKCDSRVAGASR